MDWKGMSRIGYFTWALSRLFRVNMHSVLSFPIFFFICVLLIAEFVAYCLIRLLVPFLEGAIFRLILSFSLPSSETNHLDEATGKNADVNKVCEADNNEYPAVYGQNGEADPQSATTTQDDSINEKWYTETSQRVLQKLWRAWSNLTDLKWISLCRRNRQNTIRSVYARATYAREVNARRLRCQTYEDYAKYCQKLDDVTARAAWKRSDDSSAFDSAAVRKRIVQLRDGRECMDVPKLISTLKHCIHYEFSGIFKESMYSKTFIGTKEIIEEFVDEVVLSLNFLHSHTQSYGEEIRDLMHHVGIQWGSTALILSGGAALALYHFGVCEVLLKQNVRRVLSKRSTIDESGNLLPRIICGTSAGALVAAWLCSRTDDEIKRDLTTNYLTNALKGFAPNNWFLRFWNILHKGYMCDVSVWQEFAHGLFGNETFLEAHEHTGRILNISVTRADRHEPVLVLNYKNAPHVLIYSAVLASMSFPFLGLPFLLKEKLPDGSVVDSREYESAYFHDGSLKGDIPIRNLKDTWGTKFTIVSQVNLHVFPFCGLRAHGEAGMPINWRGKNGEWKGGFLLSGLELFFKENMRFLLRLIALLDLSPTCRGINCGTLALQSYSGDVTIHPRGLEWRHLKLANDPTAADITSYIKDGRQMVFPKISFIMNRIRIDRALDKLYSAAFTACSQNAKFKICEDEKKRVNLNDNILIFSSSKSPVSASVLPHQQPRHIENFVLSCFARPLTPIASSSSNAVECTTSSMTSTDDFTQ